jgi:hypothetical protein
MENRRLQILRRLEAGEIDAEKAAHLLATLAPAEESGLDAPAVARLRDASGVRSESQQSEPIPTAPRQGEIINVAPQAAERPGQRWRRFWIYPLLAGAGVLTLGALVLGLVYGDGAAAGWLVCGWPLAVTGLLALLLAVWSRWAKWLHLRIREKDGHRIAISFPLPLTLTTWVLKILQPFVPQLKQTGADDMLIALRDSKQDEPLYIQVDDEQKGEHVEVYLG